MKLTRLLMVAAALFLAPLGAHAQNTTDPVGDWHGTLPAGAVNLRVAMHLGATSSFDSLDQNALGIPAHMTANGRHVTVTVDRVGGVFEGDLAVTAKRSWGRGGRVVRRFR